MTISISIVNWNTKDPLHKCLASIYESDYKDFEIFVVDNNSDDASCDMVKHFFPQVNLISNTQNIGFGKGNNQAIRFSKGKYILILNPDIVLQKDTLQEMLDFMDKNPDTGALGIKLLDEGGFEAKKGYFRKFPSITQILLFYTMLENICLKIKWLKNRYWEIDDTSKIMEIEQIPGACLMLRKDTLTDIGLFDESFALFFEDVDLCYRIHKSRWKLYYVPQIEAVHIGAQSISKLTYTELATRFFTSMYLYFCKHHSRLKAEIVKLIIISSTLAKITVIQFLYYLSNYKREKRIEHIRMLRQLIKNLWEI